MVLNIKLWRIFLREDQKKEERLDRYIPFLYSLLSLSVPDNFRDWRVEQDKDSEVSIMKTDGCWWWRIRRRDCNEARRQIHGTVKTTWWKLCMPSCWRQIKTFRPLKFLPFLLSSLGSKVCLNTANKPTEEDWKRKMFVTWLERLYNSKHRKYELGDLPVAQI